MKKALLLVLIGLAVADVAWGQSSITSNVFQRTVGVNNAGNTFLFPMVSRNLSIINGSNVVICVDASGIKFPGSTEGVCTDPGSFQLASSESIHLSDFISSGVSIKRVFGGGFASPVSIIVTY